MAYIKKILKTILPYKFYVAFSRFYRFLTEPFYKYFLKNKIIACLKNEKDIEKQEILMFLKENQLAMLPYPFILEKKVINVLHSSSENRPYILHKDKKLFFKNSLDNESIKSYYDLLMNEQHELSPHCYSCKKHIPRKGDIIADIGAAEAIWALDNIEFCQKAYIFECDEEWIKALKITFAPWKDKVEIINKFVSDIDDKAQNTITIDTFFNNKEIDYIKADIEGAEVNMLKGAPLTMSHKVSTAAICSYHRSQDEIEIKNYLTEYNFTEIETSKGYITQTSHPKAAPRIMINQY